LKHFALAGILLVLTLAACEDPSGVGLSLIGESGGEPVASEFPVAQMSERDANDITGGTVAGGLPRVLAGRVEDPLLGTIGATGYVDFQSPGGISDAFRNGTVTSAEIRLNRDYAYGDTASTIQLQILEMVDEWSAVGLTADSVLNSGEGVATVEYLASDTLVVLPLPAEWVEANDAILRSTTFNDDFHGFGVRPVGGGAVSGFHLASAVLRVATESDTVNYVSNRGFTSIEREAGPGLPDRIAIQDGAGPAVALQVEPGTWDTLGAVAINHAVVRLRADTTAVDLQKAPTFVRPHLTSLQLAGYRAGALVFTLNAEMNADGEFVFSRPQDIPFFFEELLANEDREVRINVPGGLHTLNPVFLHAPTATEGRPTIVFTLTRADL